MIQLPVGVQRTVTVYAKPYWNRTGLQLEEGAKYDLTVPAGLTWKDASITSGPSGYERWQMSPFFWLRRSMRNHWFALMGTIDQRHPFLIGDGTSHRAPASGELVCYANDAPLFYWNNSGELTLSVTRTA